MKSGKVILLFKLPKSEVSNIRVPFFSVAPTIGLVIRKGSICQRISVSESATNGQILPDMVQVHFR